MERDSQQDPETARLARGPLPFPALAIVSEEDGPVKASLRRKTPAVLTGPSSSPKQNSDKGEWELWKCPQRSFIKADFQHILLDTADVLIEGRGEKDQCFFFSTC
jgi:hypothetical protein